MAHRTFFLLFLLGLATTGLVEGQCTYEVELFTGSRQGAGTDADVYLRLANSDNVSLNFQLTRPRNKFEVNGVDRYVGHNACIGRICKVEVTQNGNNPNSSWYVKSLNVAVKQTSNNKCFSSEKFTINHWVKDPVKDGNKVVKYHWVPSSNCGRGPPSPNPRCAAVFAGSIMLKINDDNF